MPLLRAAGLAACLVLSACSSHASRPAEPAPEPRTVVIVSIDAFRADYLSADATPNLARIAREGVRAAWMNPSYPSLTFPNHYTLATGLRPDRHGVIHNRMSDGDIGDFAVADRSAVDDSRWWGGEPIWVTAEKQGVRSASWAWPGSSAAIGGVRPSRWVAYDERVPPARRIDDVLGWLDAPPAQRPRLVAVYFEQLDKAGHDFGPDSAQVKRTLGELDAVIGRLHDGLAARGLLASTDLIVVSDHGMATVGPNHAIGVEQMIAPSIATVVSDGQSIGVQPLPGREREAEARLLGAHAQYDCYRRDALPARWRYGTHPRVPPIVCQMHEGWDALYPQKLAKRPPHVTRGSHGFDPALPSMRALFIARGPSFVPGTELPAFDNVDVYPLLARLLGIDAAPNDGDVTPLLPALRGPASHEH
ncbi:ectonucleotide pyrophosphatase/phosphodiesterase [Lysobacter auxotrophicus]|uniref:Ectonucleotide pyrophosphatase/phosphodiesterase n=1 Tax=Lysobacter auxotrophicus TaxID=2992573 RepID=A0ABM8DB89_9GAMM|nr:ectonucleotide pyrophosphatase/phosphodiesterase [Lysobacter auxotrophicus]BDU15834.1 ectonucleotide pyrophosphatase/phosphodiesterase [Lysobacter auxotrophicus]